MIAVTAAAPREKQKAPRKGPFQDGLKLSPIAYQAVAARPLMR